MLATSPISVVTSCCLNSPVSSFAAPGKGHGSSTGEIDSGTCILADLLSPLYAVSDGERRELDLAEGWARRWTVTWKVSGRKASSTIADLTGATPASSSPVRPFTWATGQRHRPGLDSMVSTGRLHGFESLAEQKLLLALDFCGDASDVLSQPFRLRFSTTDGTGEHIPDYLAVTGSGTWLIDVRPADLIKDPDRVKFAAATEVALSRGWGYLVAAGWKPHVQPVLDAFSAQRRPLTDPLGIQRELLAAAAAGPATFRTLAEATSYPVIGRAHALHLLWHRRLAAALSEPFGDQSLVWLTERRSAS